MVFPSKVNEEVVVTDAILTIAVTIVSAIAIVIHLVYRIRQPKIGYSTYEVVRGSLCAVLLSITFLYALRTPANNTTALVGRAGLLLGICLRVWSQILLGRNWSAGLAIWDNHELVTGGPYKYLRHPMYCAYVIIGASAVFLANSLILLLGWELFWIMLFERALRESEALDRKFPVLFREWAKSKRMWFPSFYLLIKSLTS